MWQDITVYVIVAAAVIIAVRRLVLRKKDPCSGCSGCGEQTLKNVDKETSLKWDKIPDKGQNCGPRNTIRDINTIK